MVTNGKCRTMDENVEFNAEFTMSCAARYCLRSEDSRIPKNYTHGVCVASIS